MKPCGRSMTERKYGKDTGCLCNECRAIRKQRRVEARAFKDAGLAKSKTPPAQSGTWTLTAPDGRTWQADSPLKACGLEQRERVPAGVALARIVEEMERFDAESAPEPGAE
jgi:hypothetical protein